MKRIDAIAERAAKATAGPWETQAEFTWAFAKVDGPPIGECYGRSPDRAEDNAAFIAASREDVPWLCARVRELEAALQTIKAAVEDMDNGGPGLALLDLADCADAALAATEEE